MKYYIDSDKIITKKNAILISSISLIVAFVLSALLFFFVDKVMGIALLGMFMVFYIVMLVILLLGKNNNLTMPYAEIIDQDIVFFDQNSIEQKRISLSNVCSAEITTAYRYSLYTIPTSNMKRHTLAFASMIFGPKYIVFYDEGFNYLFGLYLCKENYEAFKNYLPQSQQNIKFS